MCRKAVERAQEARVRFGHVPQWASCPSRSTSSSRRGRTSTRSTRTTSRRYFDECAHLRPRRHRRRGRQARADRPRRRPFDRGSLLICRTPHGLPRNFVSRLAADPLRRVYPGPRSRAGRRPLAAPGAADDAKGLPGCGRGPAGRASSRGPRPGSASAGRTSRSTRNSRRYRCSSCVVSGHVTQRSWRSAWPRQPRAGSGNSSDGASTPTRRASASAALTMVRHRASFATAHTLSQSTGAPRAAAPPTIIARSAIHTSRTNPWNGFPACAASTTSSSACASPKAGVPAQSSGTRRVHSASASSAVTRCEASLQPVVHLEGKGRHLVMDEHRVVVLDASGSGHVPPRPVQGVEGTPVIGCGKEEVDVLHRSQSGLGVTGRHGRTLEHQRLEPGLGHGSNSQGDGTRDEEHRLHSERVGHGAERGAVGAQRVACSRRAEGTPEQWADPVLLGRRHGQGGVGAAG